MNMTPESSDKQAAGRPLSITAEEFDAKFDAGEDISDYIDWDSGVMVMPGELSPGQKRSIEMLAEAENSQSGGNGTNEEPLLLHVTLPLWAYDQLTSAATRQEISQEDLAQLLIVQRLDKQKFSS